MESAVCNVCFRGDLTIKTIVRVQLAWKNLSHIEAFYWHAILLIAD